MDVVISSEDLGQLIELLQDAHMAWTYDMAPDGAPAVEEDYIEARRKLAAVMDSLVARVQEAGMVPA